MHHQRIRECFGPEPERTALNPRVTGTVERDAYTIENVIFESRPGMLVTANLYIPKGRPFPLPGVVGTCGHSDNGKAEAAYQSFSQALARQGYVVLIYDPIGQGERLQYVNEKLGSRIGVGVYEHLYAGNQQMLVGEFFGAWRAWDGIRALDYLLTRKEVDPKHIGVTGNSGGGTMTTWLVLILATNGVMIALPSSCNPRVLSKYQRVHFNITSELCYKALQQMPRSSETSLSGRHHPSSLQ